MTVYDGDAVCEVLRVAGCGGPSPFAGLAHYGRRLETSGQRPHKLQFDIMFGDIL